jgi:hypothetical protein
MFLVGLEQLSHGRLAVLLTAAAGMSCANRMLGVES